MNRSVQEALEDDGSREAVGALFHGALGEAGLGEQGLDLAGREALVPELNRDGELALELGGKGTYLRAHFPFGSIHHQRKSDDHFFERSDRLEKGDDGIEVAIENRLRGGDDLMSVRDGDADAATAVVERCDPTHAFSI